MGQQREGKTLRRHRRRVRRRSPTTGRTNGPRRKQIAMWQPRKKREQTAQASVAKKKIRHGKIHASGSNTVKTESCSRRSDFFGHKSLHACLPSIFIRCPSAIGMSLLLRQLSDASPVFQLSGNSLYSYLRPSLNSPSKLSEN
jgi:hypothetical protein